MLQMIPKPGLSKRQKHAAIAVAAVVDVLQMPGFAVFGEGFLSPFQDALDLITAVVLTAICGFQWQFALGFVAELVPGLALLPTWTAVALLLPTAAVEGAEQGALAVPPRVKAEGRVVDREAAGGDVIDVEAVAVPPVQGKSGA